MKYVNVSVKVIRTCKKDYNWSPNTCICENGRYLKSIADTSVIVCNEIIIANDNVSTTVASVTLGNVTSTILKNSDGNKVRCKIDCYILHTVLLVIILLFIVVIICFYYAKHRSKPKNIFRTNSIKMENNEFKKVCIKNCRCYYFDDTIKFEDFDSVNKSLD